MILANGIESCLSGNKIDGVQSADQKIAGVTEGTVDVLLNFKKLAIQVPSGEPRVIRLELSGPKTVTGADVPETDIEVVNPEVHLFTLEAGARIGLEIGIGVGRGYEATDRKSAPTPAGALALDAAYSPITKVSYGVEKSLDEIKTALAALGLSLGMRIDPNVLGALNRPGVVR